jgi:predicted MFS family arabinose efflux permease
MSLATPSMQTNFKKKLFIPTLLLIVFFYNTFAYFFSIVLLDLSNSFGVSVAIASQILSVTRFAGLITGILMGILSLRFKRKSLMLTGVLLYAIGALGSAFAPEFGTMIFFQLFIGIGGSMGTIMTYALIGAVLPTEKRAFAIGLVFSTIFIANVIITPLTGIMTEWAGWRSFLLWFIFPVGIISLLIGLIVFPTNQIQTKGLTRITFFKAVKQIFSSKSTLACMVSTLLLSIFACTPLYAPTFYRTVFFVSPTTAGLFSSIVGATGIFGGLIAGRSMNQIGRKNLAVSTALFSGIGNIVFTFIPNLWGSVVIWGIAAFSVSITWAALFGLTLEQSPIFQSTTMSFNQSFRYVGAILGLMIGGLVLGLFSNNYQILMVIFGLANISLAIILLALALDPSKSSTC